MLAPLRMMKSLFTKLAHHRFGLAALVVFFLLIISLLTRIALLLVSLHATGFTLGSLLGIFFIGLFYDLINASYFIIPFMLYLWLMPQRIMSKSWHVYVLYTFVFLLAFILVFNAVSEWFFWDEFSVRFNFIAVDYLIYTTEVIGNIRQSYPVEWFIAGAVIITGSLVYVFRSWIRNSQAYTMRFGKRSIWFAAYLAVPVLAFLLVSTKLHHFSSNAYANELAGNGMYELFAAYRNNELDYEQFYKRIENEAAFADVRALLKTREASFGEDPISIQRMITADSTEKKFNVVLISVESFSASFMKQFGNTDNITPFLDSLTQHSLVFTNLYATGTRTVRGLEALSLCVPPTPGQSIVRRPNNEGLFTLSSVFNEKGYESKYIYGGYGYFDNMNYFFSNNGYQVVDRMAIPDNEIDYENIWGVADENLFELATREIDKTVANGKPAFAHVMTTSNHRPFTYPDGRIDIPSHTSRKGAVKYTDYSIGKFIKEISHKPWFNNTIVIVVADHCASSAGKTQLPVDKYHIPMLIYAPGIVQPGTMDRLMSQIDIGPTLFGMLNFSYNSKFMGYDIFKLEPGRERAFISTYQTLGYIKGNEVIALEPQKGVSAYRLENGEQVKTTPADSLVSEAVAWYQAASYAFKNNLMKN